MKSRVFRLAMAAFLLATSIQSVAAEARTCSLVLMSDGLVDIKEGGEFWRYSVKVSGPDWKHYPFGYHAPGLVGCKSCSAHGLYHMGDGRQEPPQERAQRRSEVFGYPYLQLGPSELEHYSSREQLAVGPLAGYAVRYHARFPGNKGTPDANERRGLLVVSLTDGCVTFDLTLLTPPIEGESQWGILDSLLKELTIERTPTRAMQWKRDWREREKKGRDTEARPRALILPRVGRGTAGVKD